MFENAEFLSGLERLKISEKLVLRCNEKSCYSIFPCLDSAPTPTPPKKNHRKTTAKQNADI